MNISWLVHVHGSLNNVMRKTNENEYFLLGNMKIKWWILQISYFVNKYVHYNAKELAYLDNEIIQCLFEVFQWVLHLCQLTFDRFVLYSTTILQLSKYKFDKDIMTIKFHDIEIMEHNQMRSQQRIQVRFTST